MKIVFLDKKTLGHDISLDEFNSLGQVTIYETTKQDEVLNRVKEADIIVTNKVVIDKNIMEKSKLKLICIVATGTNNIDLEYAKQKGIEVKNVSGYSTASVSQMTISMVLYFIQNLNYYKKYVDDGLWQDSDIFTHLGKPFFELENKTWGIIGLGSIGQKVANIAKSFACKINYYSTLGTNNNTDFNKIDLEELLKTSDIISIHAPLNDSTYNLLNKTNLNLLKENAILINVGRGGIINEQDLADIIDGPKSLYCGLDVMENEPIQKDNPLKFIQNKDRLLITPHIAWSSIEARNRLVKSTFDNIKDFIV